MTKKRVVVTGIGGLCSHGNSIEELWDNLIKGKSSTSRVSRFDLDYFHSQVAGEIKSFNIQDFFKDSELSEIDLSIQYGLSAAKMAMQDAQLTNEDLQREWGLVLGQTVGGVHTAEQIVQEIIHTKELKQNKYFYFGQTMPAIIYWFSKVFGISGYSDILSTGCAAATDAIGKTFHLIRDGYFDIAVTGGMEAPIAPMTFTSFDVIRALSRRNDPPEKSSCPFSDDRQGFVGAEGAGILILEEMEHAKKRGAKIYGEVVGYGNNSNAYHMTAPLPSGVMAGLAIEEAISDANIEKEKIDYINAHGSSTRLNDISETKAFKLAFGDHAYNLSISSTKSMIGHTLGASGALEFIFSILAVKKNLIPPTINLENPDPECDLDYTPNVAKKRNMSYSLSNSSGFSGVNCSVIFKDIN